MFDLKPRILFKKAADNITPTRVLDIFAMMKTPDGHNKGLSPNASIMDSFMMTVAAVDIADRVVSNIRLDETVAAASAAARPDRAPRHGDCFVCKKMAGFCMYCIDSLSDAEIRVKAVLHDSGVSAGCVGWMGEEHAVEGYLYLFLFFSCFQ
jgi:hypothetical protein